MDTTTVAWALGLRNLRIPGQIAVAAGMPYDHARNSLCEQVLRSDFQWLFFLDSDVIPPNDTILRLISHGHPVISGVYFRRSPPVGIPVMIRGNSWVTQYPPNSIIEVDYVGAGCMAIHRSVLEKLPPSDPRRGKKWFDWKVDMLGIGPPGECLSEDFSFCLSVKRHLGIAVKVDTSIQCRHVGFGQATYGNFTAIECTPAT